MIKEDRGTVVFENSLAKVGIEAKGANVSYIIDKKSGENIAASSGMPFVYALLEDGSFAGSASLTLSGNVIKARFEGLGDVSVKVSCRDRYFTFEVLAFDAPSAAELFFGCLTVSEKADSLSCGVFGAAMTALSDPVDFPDFSGHRSVCRVVPRIGASGAKYAAAVAPFALRKQILKEIFGEVDRQKGIVSSTGGVFGREVADNFYNYIIQFESSMDFIQKNLPFYKSIGVEQIDFHKGPTTFRQGDFAFARYKNATDFRENVAKTLERNGLSAGLHTYAHYIDYTCEPLLADKACREQIKVMETFTLAKAADASSTVFYVEEDTSAVSDDFGFCVVNTPYLLIDDELVKFTGAAGGHGLQIAERGVCGTKPSAHKQGAAVKHLEGRYYGLTPVLGSDLFYDIARRTAKTFNEGGFSMIYLDAIDGIASHCDPNAESSLYIALFVHELLKNCHRDPILEASTFPASMWAARGRTGAWDTPGRCYKRFNNIHTDANKAFIDLFGVPILGWYDFYPMDDRYPGNEHIKYQHTDDIDHMGSLAVAYNFPNVFNGLTPEALEKYPALRRNVFLYKKYDDLRKSGAVPISVREKMRASSRSMRLLPDTEIFQETSYQKAKLYDLSDSSRNTAKFDNPFGTQQPFVRIEALLSAENEDLLTLFGDTANASPLTFPATRRFERRLDITNCLAKHIKIHGNGRQGSKIAVKLRCATDGEKGFAEYVIDTDFIGDRDFLLIETDNGERSDHNFEQGEELYEELYGVFRTPFNNDRVTEISIESEGDTSGVTLSKVTTRAHKFVDLKDPCVTVGSTSATFRCSLRSTDFIEFDGKKALLMDRYGNSREIPFESNLTVPAGPFTAALSTSNPVEKEGPVLRAQLTLGVFGGTVEP